MALLTMDFDERVGLIEGIDALVGLSAALAVRDTSVLSAAIDRAVVEADPLAVEEVLLQSYLFLGYPAALNALALWRERSGLAAAPVVEERVGGGAGKGLAAGRGGNWEEWRARGEVVCARVYGDQYDRVRENIGRLHPELVEWMVVEGYGKVLGRPGLPLAVRELCIVVLLAGLDAAPQLRSHLRGSLLVGAAVDDVERALRVASRVHPVERMRAARAVWGEVRRRWEERRSR